MNIIGRVTKDAQVHTLSNDKQVVNFSVAINDNYRNKQGDKVEQATFFDCAYWISPKIATSLTKGTLVELTGRVSPRAWIGQDGEPKAGLNFHTSKIKLHGGSGKPAAGETAETGEAAEPQQAKAAGIEVSAETVQGRQEEHDDLPF
jgi:single-strand DNA-binding protein